MQRICVTTRFGKLWICLGAMYGRVITIAVRWSTHNRQFSDEMIKMLLERNAVIGVALDAWMMVPGWVRGQSTPGAMQCNLEKAIDHIDHICQLAGNASHVALGTDLDGAFGREQCPYDLATIADLQKLPALFIKRGYQQSDVEAILHGNWLRFLQHALP